MKKNVLALGLLVMLIPGFLGASGNGEAASPSTGKQIIKWAVPSWWLEWAEPQAENFNKQSAEYEVKIVELVSGQDMYTKMTMMMQSPRTAPDLITEDGFKINGDAAAGYLQPLDDFIKTWDDTKQFTKSILDGAKGPDGKQYGIPFSTDTQGIWYNKALFAKAGISIPWQPKNWNDIIVAALKLKASNGTDFTPIFLYASAVSPEETSMRTFQALYSGTNSALYDYGQGKWIVDRSNLLKTFAFINRVFNIDKVGPSLSLVSHKNVEDLFLNDYMKNGKLGMIFTGNWITNNWAAGKKYDWPDAMQVWGFANIPTAEGGSPGYTTMSGGWTWAIPVNAPNKKGAEVFLKYVASKDVQLSYALSRRDLAVRSDVMNDPAYLNQERSVIRETSEQLKYAHFRPSVEGYEKVSILYTELVEAIAQGTITPEQAVAQYEGELKKIVGDTRVTVK